MILNYDELPIIRNDNKRYKIGLFKGTFDLFHSAHLGCLNEIKNDVDILIVEVKSDEDVRNKKGLTRPIISEKERATIVDNIKAVDYTIIANKKESTQLIQTLIDKNNLSENEISKIKRDGYLIEQLKPDCIFTTDEKPVPKAITKLCEKLNVEIKIIPMYKGMHTTDIIKKCKDS